MLTNNEKVNKKSKIKLQASDLMPASEYAIRVLRERAEHISKLMTPQSELVSSISYVRFRLGANEYYGIPYQMAKEVIHNIAITKLPCAPDYIAGIINRRGSLIAVLDLKKFFHTHASEHESNPYIIVISGLGVTMGLLVDNIEGSSDYDPEFLDLPIPSEGVTKPEYIKGLHDGLTTIINVEAILSDKGLIIQKKSHHETKDN